MSRIAVRQGSLTDGPETVLVNASNTNGHLGTGVSGAIRKACGTEFQGHILRELRRVHGESMPPGTVLVTHAGAHPTAKYVAHVAVMDYRKGMGPQSAPTLDTVRLGCEMLWDVVSTLEGTLTVAMVALGAGTGGLGVAEPTRVACETLKAHFAVVPDSRIEKVTFYGYTLTEYLAIAHVVHHHFPEADLPEDVRSRLQRGAG